MKVMSKLQEVVTKRKPNFDAEEIKVLVESYNERKHIIEAKVISKY